VLTGSDNNVVQQNINERSYANEVGWVYRVIQTGVQTRRDEPADDGDEMCVSEPWMYRLEWEYLADVLDRLLLVVFLLLATFVTATLFAFGFILEEIIIPVEQLATTNTSTPPSVLM
jgi:hypothetical protein